MHSQGPTQLPGDYKSHLVCGAQVPLLVVLWFHPHRLAPLLAAVTFIVAAITDWADGYIARRVRCRKKIAWRAACTAHHWHCFTKIALCRLALPPSCLCNRLPWCMAGAQQRCRPAFAAARGC